MLTFPPAVRFKLLLARVAVTGPYVEAERLTAPAKPRILVRVIADVADWPSLKVRKMGDAMIRKSGPVTLTATKVDL